MVKCFSIFKDIYIGIFISILSLSFFSCSSEFQDNYQDRDDGYLDIFFSKEETRADLANDGSGSFTEGDKVGLYIQCDKGLSYRELTYSGGQWMPRLKRNDFGEGPISLSAHYPATGEQQNPETYQLNMALDQTGDGFYNSDLLFSKTVVGSGIYEADMNIGHALHRIRVSISGSMTSSEVKVRSLTQGNFNLLTGEVEVSGTDFKWITPFKDGEGNFSAVIIPQSAIPYRGDDGLLQIVAEGKTAYFNAPEKTEENNKLTFFEPGKQISINLTLRPGDSELAGKTLWVYGLNVPDFPGKENLTTYRLGKKYGLPQGQWLRYDNPYYEEQYLTWDEGCGWYDCNKSHGNYEDDSQMCWAASASNVVSWWMCLNKEYLAAYDEGYGSSVTTGSGTFKRPSYDFKPLYPNGVGSWDGSLPEPDYVTVNRSEVFQFFKDHFPNFGNDDPKGVEWFFTGAYLGGDINGFKGFLPEVFTRNNALTARSPHNPDREQFNTFVTDALLNKRAIGLNVFDVAGPKTGNHAMTAWGVEYDEAGDIAYIYYSDNNSADQDPNGAVIIRQQIVYAVDSYGKECTYLQQLKPEDPDTRVGKFLITSVFSADLGRDIWKKKYPNVVVEK